MMKVNYKFENFYLENYEKSRILPQVEFKINQNLFKNKNNKSEVLSPFLSFIYAEEVNQDNLPNINSGFFLDSHSFSKDILSGDSYVPMRRDILLGADYLLLEKKKRLNISFSRLFGLGKRFLETNLFRVDLPEPYQVIINYKNGENFNFFS